MKKWIWQFYGLVLTFITFNSLKDIYTDSPLRTYYTVLIAFDPHYILLFAMNILSILFGILGPIVILLYTLDIKSTPIFWRFCFWTRLLLDLGGHSYDTQFIYASFHQGVDYGLVCATVFILPFIPAYWVHFRYAYKNKSITNPKDRPE